MSLTIDQVKDLQKNFEGMILDAVDTFESLSGLKVENMQIIERDGKRDIVVSANFGQ